MQRKIRFPKKLKIAVGALALFCASENTFGQSVGVNTNNPDPSASLEVAGTNKGLLIPRVNLLSSGDLNTIPNPATALLVYNTNASWGKAGFYYNAGTPANPAWTGVGAGVDLILPFSKNAFNAGPLFLITNLGSDANGSAITGSGIGTIGVRGISQSGRGVVGFTSTTGIGVQAASANINGTALEVSGRMQIHGPGQTIEAGRVLTSDANGFATWENAVGADIVAFSASGIASGGSQNIPKSPAVKVAFGIEDYDLSSAYNDVYGSPHSTFNVPFNGIYHFDVGIYFNYANTKLGTVCLVRIRNSITTDLICNSSSSVSVSISKDIQLQSGDQLFVRLAVNDDLILPTDPAGSYFSGRLVSKQ